MFYKLTSSAQDNEEVHAVDTNARIVSDTQIDVFSDTEAEVSSCREVASLQLVFLDLEALLEDLFGLLASHCARDGDLLVSSNTERTNSVSSLKTTTNYSSNK